MLADIAGSLRSGRKTGLESVDVRQTMRGVDQSHV